MLFQFIVYLIFIIILFYIGFLYFGLYPAKKKNAIDDTEIYADETIPYNDVSGRPMRVLFTRKDKNKKPTPSFDPDNPFALNGFTGDDRGDIEYLPSDAAITAQDIARSLGYIVAGFVTGAG